MLKILHIHKIANIAGSENHLLSLLPGLRERGFEPTMAVLVGPKDNPENFIRTLQEKGIPSIVFKIRQSFDIFLLISLFQFIRSQRFDVVHTHLIHADLHGTIAARLAGTKLVISSRHNDNEFRTRFPYRQVAALSTFFAHHIICISQNVFNFNRKYEKISAKRMSVIYYGFKEESTGTIELREQLAISPDTVLLGIVARLTKQKGHDILLEAFKKVSAEFTNTGLVIVGDGELRKTLESKAATLQLPNVYFLGYRSDAPKLMKSFDIFVHPSRWEGFGLVFLEAMAAKLPIVATEVGSIPEIVIDKETGILVPSENASSLADAINYLIRNPELRKQLGENGKKRLHEHFSLDVMIEKTASLYKRLLLS